MRIHELIKDAKLTKEGLEYLSDLDERIKEENKHLLDEIQKLRKEKAELKDAYSFENHYNEFKQFKWRVYEIKTKDEVVEELRSKIKELRDEVKKYLDKITAYNSKTWLNRLFSLNRKIHIQSSKNTQKAK